MKIRNGFVSNSSTSSFLIYGVYLEEYSNDAKKLYKKYGMEDDHDSYALGDKINLDVKSPPDCGLYIGLSPTSMKDTDTLGEFKTDVAAKLKEILGKDVECCWHEYAWYNG